MTSSSMLKSKYIKKFLALWMVMSLGFTQVQAMEKDIVAAQMNYCINSLTNIINANSMEELNHEIDQIVNNLSKEQIAGMPEINFFRKKLLETAQDLQITQEERVLLNYRQSLSRDKAKWNAFSSALNNVIIPITSGEGKGNKYAIAFYTLLTAARAGVEYMNDTKQMDIDEIAELWALKKRNMELWKSLRSDAMDIVYNLYTQYHLKEFDGLTEETANLFNLISKEPDSQKRIRLLSDNEKILGNQLNYNYILGMSYYNLGNIQKANDYFKRYEDMYRRVKLFRYDERSGLIALARLQESSDLSHEKRKDLIDTIIFNLPLNGAAHLACVMSLLGAKDIEGAAEVVRKALDKPNMTDRQAMLMCATKLVPNLPQKSTKREALLDAMKNYRTGYLFVGAAFDIYSSGGITWDYWKSAILLENVSSSDWYTLWMGKKHLDKNFELGLPGKTVSEDSLQIFVINKHKNKINITNEKFIYKYGVSKLKILTDVKIIRENPQLLSVFFNPIIPDSVYLVKTGINYDALQNGDSRCNEVREIKTLVPAMLFSATKDADKQVKNNAKEGQKMLKKLAKFLKKHENKSSEYCLLKCKPAEGEENTYYYKPLFLKNQSGKNSIRCLYLSEDSAKLLNEREIKEVKSNALIKIYHPSFDIDDDGDYILLSFNDFEKFSVLYRFNEGEDKMQLYSITMHGITHFKDKQLLIYKNVVPKSPDSEKVNAEKTNEDDEHWYDSILNNCSLWIDNVIGSIKSMAS
jgi:hypothetical protein